MQRNLFNPFQNNFFSRNQSANNQAQRLQKIRNNEQLLNEPLEEVKDPLQEEVKERIKINKKDSLELEANEYMQKDTEKIFEQTEKKHIESNTNEHTKPFTIDENTLKEIQNHYNIGENGRDLDYDRKENMRDLDYNRKENGRDLDYDRNENIRNLKHNRNEAEKHKTQNGHKEGNMNFEEKIAEEKIQKSIINQKENIEYEKEKGVINTNSSMKNLGLIIQNTRNTKLFYENLYELSGHKNAKIIIEMVQITETIKEIFMKIYVERNGSEYIINEMPINTNIEYKKALLLAKQEETIALKEFIDFYKGEENQKVKDEINIIILYKICVINLLHLL